MLQVTVNCHKIKEKGNLDLHPRGEVEVRNWTKLPGQKCAPEIGSQQTKPRGQAGWERNRRQEGAWAGIGSPFRDGVDHITHSETN